MNRRPTLIRTADAPDLAGRWHLPAAGAARDLVAVLAYPMGYEAVHGYRAFRHLADRLAARGVAVLRFDYRGTGDSADAPSAPTLADWRADVARACVHARQASGRPRVVLIGARVGALLAAQSEASADALVLWHPVLNGRRYARELQAIAATSQGGAGEAEGLEVAGFHFASPLLEELRGSTLAPPCAREGTLCLIPTGAPGPLDAPAVDGATVEYAAFDGWAEMIAEPQFTRVPETAIARIVDWVAARARPAADFTPPEAAPLAAADLREEARSFEGVSGILTHPALHVPPRPAVLLLNSGSVHHVGPNRLYVDLARRLARAGHACLRIDFQGLGESALPDPRRENHPYPDTANADVRRALAMVGGGPAFLVGICSGAHAAFRAALEPTSAPHVREAVLINPLTYRWREGMSLETTAGRQFQEIAHYRQSLRRGGAWKKLLRGEVKFGHAAKIGLRQIDQLLARVRAAFVPGDLDRELDSLRARALPISLWVSPGDPGLALLRAGAPRATARAIRAGAVTVRELAHGDHTFTKRAARRAFIDALTEHLSSGA